MKRGVVGMADFKIDDLYNNIKNRRIELNMTQTELAQKVGYADKGMISRVENGKVDLSQSQIIKFAEALDIDPGTLMGWNDILIEVAQSKGDREEAHLIEYAKRLYEHYQKASPEIQKAVDVLLKADKQP
jgi:transcriptional regulator with XRE-family HTH domain